MILTLVLLIINVFIFINTKEPEKLRAVKERYTILRRHIHDSGDPEFAHLVHEIPITAHHRPQQGSVGYNINKGHEIGLCIDGETNEIMHVLIHELAHGCVDEYEHSSSYWDKYDKLKSMCVAIGIYQEIPEKTKFCGKHIQDK
ncbi:MAG: hypothetical protein CBB67_008735 [Alteromonadaceae bacterium TMED7]|jgi:hypothetical protein|nr:MAG: hypothetical protein CBB67_008735 [Alteromonadaceae bacterium TMED7]|tara:strand:+ start:782 stop:1213 length:432 start_codon:yes stop_codon:yes gene_type:complete